MKERPVRKIYVLSGATMEENCIKGDASALGNMDRGRDVMYPKCYRKALPDFLENGFVPIGHDWHDLPVAMPTKATEKGNRLYTEAVFHSHQKAQDARTVCMERMANGLSVGLSVGFMPDYANGVHYFEKGDDLLAHAKGLGCDLDLFDTKTISACKSYCRGISNVTALFEYSIVSVPMNPQATATSAKAFGTEREFERFLREAGFSKSQATAITLHGFGAALRDAETDEDESDIDDTEALAAKALESRTQRIALLRHQVDMQRALALGAFA